MRASSCPGTRQANRYEPTRDATNENVAVEPGGRIGVAAPRNDGVIVIGPGTTAHEWSNRPRFVHRTRTRHPRGMLTSSSPRP